MIECAAVAEQISSQFYKKNPHLSYDLILNEAANAMVHAYETYDPDKERNLKSWTGFIVHRELNKQFKHITSEIEFLEFFADDYSYNPERICILKDTINNLSEASKQALDILFKENISPDLSGKNEIKREIKSKLREYGFAWNKIQKAFSELKMCANNIV